VPLAFVVIADDWGGALTLGRGVSRNAGLIDQTRCGFLSGRGTVKESLVYGFEHFVVIVMVIGVMWWA
jgi:hypothetical protein